MYLLSHFHLLNIQLKLISSCLSIIGNDQTGIFHGQVYHRPATQIIDQTITFIRHYCSVCQFQIQRGLLKGEVHRKGRFDDIIICTVCRVMQDRSFCISDDDGVNGQRIIFPESLVLSSSSSVPLSVFFT